LIITFFNFCSEEKPTEQLTSKEKSVLQKTNEAGDKISFSITGDSTKTDSVKIKDKEKEKNKGKGGGITPNALEYGWKYENEYVFDHYVANGEFGIWPSDNRQYAGSSGDPNRIQKLNELKSIWGFNYIAANIGDYNNIQAIVAAGFPINTNYLATGFTLGDSGDRNTVQNMYNGLAPSTYFWGYYMDEPYNHDCCAPLTQYSFKSFRDFVKSIKPNSLFGFGETYYMWANFYTHNPYEWVDGNHTNYYPANVDFVMCTRYDSFLGTSIDQRPLWDGFKSKYNNIFARTWIAAHKDGSEFRNLLGYCRDQGYAPWFYQKQDGYDYNDQMIASYCNAAWLEGFLRRYDKKYEVWYRCILNHTHNPNQPENCLWEEDSRLFLGIVQQ